MGKWHLAAHILACFPKFSLNFVEGAAQVDGEILEILWSPLDEVVGLTQAMSVTHHQEVPDDYMNDSNWQKIVQIGRELCGMHIVIKLTIYTANSLCGKWTQATQGVSNTEPAFKQLTDSLDVALVQEWTRQE